MLITYIQYILYVVCVCVCVCVCVPMNGLCLGKDEG